MLMERLFLLSRRYNITMDSNAPYPALQQCYIQEHLQNNNSFFEVGTFRKRNISIGKRAISIWCDIVVFQFSSDIKKVFCGFNAI